jgi:endonuclease/exonuclease/phosphatase family metal-dependent hydrolase
MKITTLNLEGFTNWEDRKDRIFEYLRTTNPDIIFFQEVVFLPRISPITQVEILDKSLHYTYSHVSISRLQTGTKDPVFREGLAILSKAPVTKTEVIVLKKDLRDEHNRIIQLVDVVINHKILKFVNVHYSITDTYDLATPQLEETLSILEARGEERIIIGDFNINDLNKSREIWQDKYDSSTSFNYVSYPDMDKRNDYILIPKSFKIEFVTVSGDELSDHRALTAVID